MMWNNYHERMFATGQVEYFGMEPDIFEETHEVEDYDKLYNSSLRRYLYNGWLENGES